MPKTQTTPQKGGFSKDREALIKQSEQKAEKRAKAQAQAEQQRAADSQQKGGE